MANPSDIRRKNEQFAKNVREGKPALRKSSRELAQKHPLGTFALALIGFVIFGGFIFELVRIMFL